MSAMTDWAAMFDVARAGAASTARRAGARWRIRAFGPIPSKIVGEMMSGVRISTVRRDARFWIAEPLMCAAPRRTPRRGSAARRTFDRDRPR